jgi:hypothetical protein
MSNHRRHICSGSKRAHAPARTHARTHHAPGVLDWRKNVASGGMWNTPATLNIWSTGKVAHWIQAEGGIDEMARRAATKAAALYSAIEGSAGFYATPVAAPLERSRMNVPFSVRGGKEEVTHAFLREAYEQNMVRAPPPSNPALSITLSRSRCPCPHPPTHTYTYTHPPTHSPPSRAFPLARWASAR